MARKSDKQRDPTQIVGLQLRFREDLRARIERAAEESGNSMNTEIATRLERSLDAERHYGDAQTRALVRDIIGRIALIEGVTVEEWHRDPTTYYAVWEAVADIFNRARPIPPNFEALSKLQAEQLALTARRDALRKFLVQCNAATIGMNTLAGLLLPEAERHGVVTEKPMTGWHWPERPDELMTGDEINFTQERIAELREIEARHGEITTEMAELMEPWQTARTNGRAIYRSLTSIAEPETQEAD